MMVMMMINNSNMPKQLHLVMKNFKKNPGRIMKLYPFINKHNWYRINFPSEKDDWVKFEKINSAITLNVLYKKEKETFPDYI